MNSRFREISAKDIDKNTFSLIGDEWMLVTAGDETAHNTMTASWGGLGVLWFKDVSTIYIRPQRYTLKFIDEQDTYSLCFFDEEYRKALTFCGRASGRDVDKDKETGLTVAFDNGTPYYEEAKLVIICKKLYKQTIDPECFLVDGIDEKAYPDKDYHEMFIGSIEKVYIAD